MNTYKCVVLSRTGAVVMVVNVFARESVEAQEKVHNTHGLNAEYTVLVSRV